MELGNIKATGLFGSTNQVWQVKTSHDKVVTKFPDLYRALRVDLQTTRKSS